MRHLIFIFWNRTNYNPQSFLIHSKLQFWCLPIKLCFPLLLQCIKQPTTYLHSVEIVCTILLIFDLWAINSYVKLYVTRKVAAFGGLSSIRTKGHTSYKNDIISKTFLFMGNMSPYYFKTIFRLCVECIPSFIKIGGAVSEKNGRTRQTFVVLYIGWFA